MDNSLHICETTTNFCGLFQCGQKINSCCFRLNTNREILNPFSYKYHLAKIVVFLKKHNVYVNIMTSISFNQPAPEYLYRPFKTHNVKPTVVHPQKNVTFLFLFWNLNPEDRLAINQISCELTKSSIATLSAHVFNNAFIVFLLLNNIVSYTFYMLESYTGSTFYTIGILLLAFITSFSTQFGWLFF